jgi:AcrR family transcriptional regulator
MKKRAPPKKRSYDNATRLARATEGKKRIVETLVELLVEKKGGDVTFKEISARSGIPERTIFRFYTDKSELHSELDSYLGSYIGAAVVQLSTMDVAAFAKNAFLLFDKHEPLVLAYLYSPFGREARSLFRRKLNKLIDGKLRIEKKLSDNLATRKKIALICSLINAEIWNDIRKDFSYSGAEMGDSVDWAIRALIKEL